MVWAPTSVFRGVRLESRVVSTGSFFRTIRPFISKYEAARDPTVPWTVGLAVSGGVDSMALALLCSNLRGLNHSPDNQAARDMQFVALIVDHGARPGSREEALKVTRVLQSRKIPARILTIKWPDGVIPSEIPNFESVARKYRYQALGQACRNLNIKQLLMAHHADDQAETVLMRILDGHRGRGLGVMKWDSAIPDCYGMHGVYCSGGLPESEPNKKTSENQAQASGIRLETHTQVEEYAETWNRGLSARYELARQSNKSDTDDSESNFPMKLEYGGLRIIRPLRHVSKRSLIYTCQESAMPWFEDATNKDPSITTRNAIRYLFQKHTMPGALSKKTLLQIAIKERANSRVLEGVLVNLKNSWARELEPRTGTIVARFTHRMLHEALQQKIPDELDGNLQEVPLFTFLRRMKKPPKKFLRTLSLLVLRDLVKCVSPRDQLPLKSFINASKHLFPSLYSDRNELSGLNTIDAFTVAGVKFQRRPATLVPEGIEFERSVSETHEWFVAREPHFSCLSRQPKLEILPQERLRSQEAQFSFYDGRYWIRTENFSQKTLYIRPFQETDMNNFRSSLNEEMGKKFKKLLKTLAPGHVRYTVPAIVDENDKVLALPSLRIHLPGTNDLIKYEIRYKEVPEYVRKEYEQMCVKTTDNLRSSLILQREN